MMPDERTVFAQVPVNLAFPREMAVDIEAVLRGEHEAGYDGEGLLIIDIGANVGAFSIWASLRWPGSRVHAYEPDPGTFEILTRNVTRYPNIICHEQAVYPGDGERRLLFRRYPGDGEAGLTEYIGDTFTDIRDDLLVEVDTVHPRTLPASDVLKIDVEGGEGAILEAMDVSDISLILVEYQNLENRRAIEERLEQDFTCVFEDSFPWEKLLEGSGYRRSLAGDSYGHLFFVNRRRNRLRGPGPRHAEETLSLRRLVRSLPAAVRRSAGRRFGNP